MLNGFRNFVMRGNVVDLAVGVIIGAAFGKVVDGFMVSFVNPLIGLVLGGADPAKAFETFHIGPFPIGLLISSIINFLLIAMVIYFFIVVPINKMKKNDPVPAPPGPSNEELLLMEIRDELKKR
ncbi:MAG: large conductance mechanosensitive channel protein MscL [Saprospiraceae bacterium]